MGLTLLYLPFRVTSNFESTYKNPSFIKFAFFLNVYIFSVKLPWLQRRDNKRNTTLIDRNYSQNSKAITFRKIINHKKYK